MRSLSTSASASSALLACAFIAASCETTSGLTGGDNPGGGDAGACASGQKVCDGQCVEVGDPRYGCTESGCTPCSGPESTTFRCDPGKCRVSSCEPGFDDCDGDPSNGCETDLSKPSSCGSCTRNCPSDAKLCDHGHCAAACSPGTTDCEGSCADLLTHPKHCGSCTTACPTTPNAQSTCTASQCGIRCNTGYGDCDGDPKTCEALKPYYVDADSDGHGAGAAVGSACTAPAGHSLANDDCNDTNKNVHPGQTGFFMSGYVNASGKTSYDYDCNGKEENDPAKLVGGTCSPACKDGYQGAPSKREPGTNQYCGSAIYVTCSASCLTTTSATTSMGCR